MASADHRVRYCIKCENTEFLSGKKSLMCEECGFRLLIDEARPEKMAAHVGEMTYCYNCGTELIKSKKGLNCIDGCGISIPTSQVDQPDAPQAKANSSRTYGKQSSTHIPSTVVPLEGGGKHADKDHKFSAGHVPKEQNPQQDDSASNVDKNVKSGTKSDEHAANSKTTPPTGENKRALLSEHTSPTVVYSPNDPGNGMANKDNVTGEPAVDHPLQVNRQPPTMEEMSPQDSHRSRGVTAEANTECHVNAAKEMSKDQGVFY